jgi:ATP-dependent Lon protease
MNVAKTVAWNLLTDDEKKNVIDKYSNTGLHIHCPDGATPKDGPSAGTAITCAIYSVLTNKVIKNDIAITGEIDLDGNVTAIGGLDLKLYGAKKAGITLALVPEENKRDLDIITKKYPDLVDNKFSVKMINRVEQAINYVFLVY